MVRMMMMLEEKGKIRMMIVSWYSEPSQPQRITSGLYDDDDSGEKVEVVMISFGSV